MGKDKKQAGAPAEVEVSDEVKARIDAVIPTLLTMEPKQAKDSIGHFAAGFLVDPEYISGRLKVAKDAAEKQEKVKAYHGRIEAYTVPKGVIALCQEAVKLGEPLPRLVVSGRDEETGEPTAFALAPSHKGKGRTSSGNGGSNISAWAALQQGGRAGDPSERITRGEGRGAYLFDGAPIEGSLMAFLRANRETFPETYDVLKKYGKAD